MDYTERLKLADNLLNQRLKAISSSNIPYTEKIKAYSIIAKSILDNGLGEMSCALNLSYAFEEILKEQNKINRNLRANLESVTDGVNMLLDKLQRGKLLN